MDTIHIGTAERSDLRHLLSLQKTAYLSEAKLYPNDPLPPLQETLEELEKSFQNQRILKATRDDQIVGSIRGFAKGKICYVGRLIVDPSCQNRGLGTRLLDAIEECFPESVSYELFTGHKSHKNLHLYKKVGYEPIREEVLSEGLTLTFLQKPNLIPTQTQLFQ